jgi:hypothetical protein
MIIKPALVPVIKRRLKCAEKMSVLRELDNDFEGFNLAAITYDIGFGHGNVFMSSGGT